MGKLIKAKKIWEDGSFVGLCQTEFVIQCDKITGSTPRLAWLVPLGTGCCGLGGGYKLEFTDPNPNDPGANVLQGVIKGVWIEADGHGALYDATDVDDVVEACNACCDDTTTVVDPVYNGVFPNPADITPTLFTVTRTDNGSAYDLNRARLDYLGQHIEGTFQRTAYAGGESTYTFQAKNDPHPIGSDTIVETDRTFDSNAPGAIAGSSHYIANATINGVAMPVLEDDAYNALSDVATAAAGNATWAAQGTWSVVSGKLRLTSGSAVSASIVITSAAD